jgi:hypothetical protein
VRDLSRFETRLIQLAVMALLAFGSTSFAQAQCVSKASELETVPAVKSFIDRLGGTNRLFGAWEFGGVGFGIGRTTLRLNNRDDLLKGKVDDSREVAIKICANGKNISLEVPGKGTYALRAQGRGTLELAGEATGGAFYAFQYRGGVAQGGPGQMAESTPRRLVPVSTAR